MNQRSGTLETRGGSYIYRGDPGAYELMELRVRRIGREGRVSLRATGAYDVAGEVDYSRVYLDVRENTWLSYSDELTILTKQVMAGEEDAASVLLAQLTEWGLEEVESYTRSAGTVAPLRAGRR